MRTPLIWSFIVFAAITTCSHRADKIGWAKTFMKGRKWGKIKSKNSTQRARTDVETVNVVVALRKLSSSRGSLPVSKGRKERLASAKIS